MKGNLYPYFFSTGGGGEFMHARFVSKSDYVFAAIHLCSSPNRRKIYIANTAVAPLTFEFSRDSRRQIADPTFAPSCYLDKFLPRQFYATILYYLNDLLLPFPLLHLLYTRPDIFVRRTVL